MLNPVLSRAVAGAGQLPSHVGHQTDPRLLGRHPDQQPGKFLGHGFHQHRVKRVRDRQPMYPPTLPGELIRQSADRRRVTGNHHRVGAVDRRYADTRCKQRRHFLFAGGHGDHRPTGRQRRHQPAPNRHQSRSIIECQHARHVCRGDLAHRMTHHHVGQHAPVLPQGRQCHFDREQCRLREFGVFQ